MAQRGSDDKAWLAPLLLAGIILLLWVGCFALAATFRWLGLHHCLTNGSGQSPCIVYGIDVDTTSFVLAMSGAIFGPIFFIGAAVCLVVSVVLFVVSRYRSRRS